MHHEALPFVHKCWSWLEASAFLVVRVIAQFIKKCTQPWYFGNTDLGRLPQREWEARSAESKCCFPSEDCEVSFYRRPLVHASPWSCKHPPFSMSLPAPLQVLSMPAQPHLLSQKRGSCKSCCKKSLINSLGSAMAFLVLHSPPQRTDLIWQGSGVSNPTDGLRIFILVFICFFTAVKVSVHLNGIERTVGNYKFPKLGRFLE